MFRKSLVATALAGALALAPVAATPAFAAPDAQDYAKMLLGLVAVGAIANALENERDRERAREISRSNTNNSRYDDIYDDRYDNRRDGNRHDGNRNRRALPARCAFEVRTQRGWSDVFGKRCLEREGVRVGRLPEACEFQVRTDRGRRDVFGERCLREYGYRVEAGRR